MVPKMRPDLVVLKIFIEDTHQLLAQISRKILEAEKRAKSCAGVISDLEIAIPKGKRALRDEEANLAALLEIRARSHEPRRTGGDQERLSPHLDNLMIQFSFSPLSDTTLIDHQIEVTMESVQIKGMRINELELELEGWRKSMATYVGSLDHLREVKREQENFLDDALQQDTTRPVYCVPERIWARIFRFVVSVELNDYHNQDLASPYSSQLRLTPVYLSWVCKLWRRVIDQDSELWGQMAILPCKPWSPRQRQAFNHSIYKAGSFAAFVVTSTRDFRRAETASQRPNSGRRQSRPTLAPVPSEENTTLDRYSLHLHSCNRDLISSIPLRNPFDLTLSPTVPLTSENLSDFFTHFSALKSLSIQNAKPIFSTVETNTSFFRRSRPTPFISNFQQLTSLKIKVQQFPVDFDITPLLSPELEELDFQYEGVFSWLESKENMKKGVKLSKLRTLGVSAPCSSIISYIQAPLLTKLVVYGSPKLQGIQIAPGENAATIYCQLLHLELEDWEADPLDKDLCAVKFFWGVISKQPRLRQVKFSHCWVNGSNLIYGMNRLANNMVSGLVYDVEEMTLSHAQGITREECDQLNQLVRKLNVYS